MPELRKDPVVGRWVIIATERARRPGNIVDSDQNYFEANGPCEFCHHAGEALFSLNGVKVIPSGTPFLSYSDTLSRKHLGLYDVINGVGAHEVVIETPEHIANMADLPTEQIESVIKTYVGRFNQLREHPHFQYVFAFKNYGWTAGARRLGHSRSQIIATPVDPFRIKEKLNGAKKYFDYHERCLYCDLIKQENEQNVRVVAETNDFLAITPFAARFLFEVWILPKKHACDFHKGVVGVEGDLAKMMKDILLRLKIGLQDPAYNYVIQTAPFRRGSLHAHKWETIADDYHWHIEIMPRLTRAAGFEKGTGFYICVVPPEATAGFLREVKTDV